MSKREEGNPEVVKRGETPVSNFYKKYGEAATNRRIVGDLLKYGKDGAYTAGQEGREIK